MDHSQSEKTNGSKIMGYAWMILWISFYLLYLTIGESAIVGSVGVNRLGGHSYLRLFSGIFFHKNFIHFFANVLAYYWIAHYLLKGMRGYRIFSFGLIAAGIQEIITGFIYPNLENGFGGSSVNFALIGLITAMQISSKDFAPFYVWKIYKRNGSWQVDKGSVEGNWIALYAVLTNIPVGMIRSMTIVTHVVAFIVGLVLGLLGITTFHFLD